MALKFNITISREEILKKWSEQCTDNEWIEMYKNLSDSYHSWDTDLKIAEFIIKRVKEGYIDKYKDENIPEILQPLLINAITNDIVLKNEKNKNIILENVSSELELKAIETLRNYSFITYEDALNIFCDAYESVETSITNLSDVSTEDLMEELKNRM